MSSSFSAARLHTWLRIIAFAVPLLALSASAHAQTLPNGGAVRAAITTPREQDSYTFAANAGEAILLQASDLLRGSFTPRISLFGPDATLVSWGYGANVASVVVSAPKSGTYTAVVYDVSNGGNAVGSYDLFFVRAPGANEGGALPNGGVAPGRIDQGDLDSFTFSANAGEGVVLRAADVTRGALVPRVSLYGPAGSLISWAYGSDVASIAVAVPATGTYTVVVYDVSNGSAAEGDYNLYFALAPTAQERGVLANGGVAADTIDIGDVDSYRFSGTVGEGVVLQVADLDASSLVPRVSLYGPSGSLVTWAYGNEVASIALSLPTTGVYTAVVYDVSDGSGATGRYNLYFAKAPGAREGGAIANGSVVANVVDKGDVDSYVFDAKVGEGIVAQVADLARGGLVPRLSLYGPTGKLVTWAYGNDVASIALSAPETGTYTLLTYDVSNGSGASGSYNLYFAKAPGAKEGGTFPNGGVVSQRIDQGDVDSYQFNANAGEGIVARVADLARGAFVPRVSLYGPAGQLVTWSYGSNVASIATAAPATGTYTLLVYDVSNGSAAAGDYNLYLATAPGANEGGTLPNGGVVAGVIDQGDIDTFTLAASQGETIHVQVADLARGALLPRVSLYGPTGALVDSSYGHDVAAVYASAPSTGTYTVAVYDVSNGSAATGAYNLYFVRAPGALQESALVNGGVAAGTVDQGDLDSWNFTAKVGEGIELRVADLSASNFVPRVALYGPTGALLQQSYGNDAAAVALAAPSTGTYWVEVYDVSNGSGATGNYNLYFARAPGANEHGTLASGVAKTGVIDKGDLDSYTFAGVSGTKIRLVATDTANGALTPFVVLYGPTGKLVTSTYNTTVATLNATLPESGTYTVVVKDASNGLASTGAYTIALTSPLP